MSVDKYLGLTYDKRAFNCAHFACMVWEDLTGQDIRANLTGFTRPRAERKVNIAQVRLFARLAAPVSPCLVLMSRALGEPHAGVYLRGKVLHITEAGVNFEFLEVASCGFNHVRFYNVPDANYDREYPRSGRVERDAD